MRLPLVLPKIQANLAGAADALMLDENGFVSETNATNVFLVRDRILYTPHADACLPGITRATVLEIARELGIPAVEKNLSLTEFYTADEVFTTGTMGELTPVTMIDGRVIGSASDGGEPGGESTPRYKWFTLGKLQQRFRELTEAEGVPFYVDEM